MAYQLAQLADGQSKTPALDEQELSRRIERLLESERPRYQRLWAYYLNPLQPRTIRDPEQDSDRPYVQAQEWGLPERITASRGSTARKEVVIENDIGWRIDTQVDYLFGKPIVISSAAPDPQRRQTIGRLLRLILAHNGGIPMLQQLALLGAVYGFVDVLVKLEQHEEPGEPAGSAWPDLVPGPHPLDALTQQNQAAAGLPAPAKARVQDLGQPPAASGPAPDETSSGPQPAPTENNSPAEAAAPSPHLRQLDDSPIAGARTSSLEAHLMRLARMIRLEIVEPARALPFLSPQDYRIVTGYWQCWEVPRKSAVGSQQSAANGKWWQRWLGASTGLWRQEQPVRVVEIITPTRWQRYEDQALVAQGANSLGQLPLVHIQNTALPFAYSGGSDVEPLIPLQDELNVRLSDRAHRIALQSFKMYLGKNIEHFGEEPVAPGRMWATDDPEAQIIEFGGDAACPSEETHINEMREAMDKASGVSPIAAGAIKNRIGRLTSAAALRVTLMSLLAKTDRKRTAYGAAIERMCELSLAWLDKAGLFATRPEERRIEINWPSPLPENDAEKLQEAEIKLRLGVPREVVLREMGY